MKKLTILVDMDDVLDDLCKVWADTLNKLFEVNVQYEDIIEWDMQKAFPMLSKQEIYWPLGCEWMWERINPLPGAIDTVKKLIKDGHKLVIVTASAPETIEPKLKKFFFRRYPFFTMDDVIIAKQKYLIEGDVLIDDGVHNFDKVRCNKILMTAPHNKNFDAEGNGMRRANNWDEIYKIICEIAGSN